MKEVKITTTNFESEVINSDIPVLLDFYADWCGPCKMIAPVLSEISEELDGRIKVGKVNVDENSELAAKYGVMSIPTLIYIKNGMVINQTVGFHTKSEILDFIA